MEIWINAINLQEPKLLGYTNMVSYPVHLRCAMFQGWARWVPFDENLEKYLQCAISVEVAHEAIDDLRPSAQRPHHIVPLAQAFAYHVCGEVNMIVHHAAPKGNQTTYVVAGDAAFALSLADLGGYMPREGDTVEFDVYGLSLWDESI